MAALIPYEKTRKLLCQAIYNPQGVVDLIFHEDKLKVIPHAIQCPEGAAVLIPCEKKLKLLCESLRKIILYKLYS